MSGANVDDVFDRVETKVKGLLDENAQLREQNRVLAEAFAKTTKGKVTINRYEHGGGRMFVDDGKNRDLIADTYNEGDREFIALCYEVFSKRAALTATSQPAQEQCSYCKRPLTDNHSFSYGVPGVPRVYKCDRADCTKPATSQEGQHG